MSKLIVRETELMGSGLFALEPLVAGETVLYFKGAVSEVDPSHDDPEQMTSSLQLTCELCLSDADSEDDFVNHSCDPNAYVLVSGRFEPGEFVDDERVRLVARREIVPGEQITFDYSLNVCLPRWRLHTECCCGASLCRKAVLPIGKLPADYLHDLLAKGELSGHMVGHVSEVLSKGNSV